MGAIMENNNASPERSAAVNNAGQFTGKQTLYTPTGEVLHMHIYCSPLAIAGEENKRITASQRTGGVA